MTRRKATERWGKKKQLWGHTSCNLASCEILYEEGRRKAQTAIHGPSGPKFLLLEKANTIADCLENQFTPHDLHDENHEWRLESKLCLKPWTAFPPEKVRPCDVLKLINSLKLRKACGNYRIPNECLRHLPRRPLVHLTHLFNHFLRLSHFPSSCKEAKVITLPKPWEDSKFLQNLRPVSFLPKTGKPFEEVIIKIGQSTLKKRTC
jgi:hypothetical protein